MIAATQSPAKAGRMQLFEFVFEFNLEFTLEIGLVHGACFWGRLALRSLGTNERKRTRWIKPA
jgi:hypothetical protein